ncbi:MAG: hypothetical protein H6738_23840 [Alphaproteobacteria bacterium]|nr:hypothetical protein [Alphaproteobacteria bacterium]
MLTLLLAGATSTIAHAQAGPRVDPAYIDYLRALQELEDLGYAPPTAGHAQLWPGQIGIYTPLGEIAKGSATGTFPSITERWYVKQMVAPDAEFELRHEGSWPLPEQYVNIAEFNDNWDIDPCWVMNINYKGDPNPDYTLGLVYADNIDRYTFDLVQDGVIVGRMLREYHHVEGAEERFVDHWAFADGYEAPGDVGESVLVVPAVYQYPTTTAYFADILIAAPGAWDGFAQVQYKTIDDGWNCLPGLQLP